MDDASLRDIVVRTISGLSADAGFRSADVTPAIDFDGTPVLRVTAHYATRTPALVGASAEIIEALRDQLLSRGEERFVFVTNAYEDQTESDLEDVE